MNWSERAERKIFEVAPGFAHSTATWVAKKMQDPQAALRQKAMIEEALRAVGLWSEPLVEMLSGLHGKQAADLRLIRCATVQDVKGLQRGAAGGGVEAVGAALAGGRGLIFGCTHIGLFHHALIHAGTFASEIMVVTGNQNYSPEVVKRLEVLSGLRIKMEKAQTSSAMSIARHLRRGGVVATMLDHYVETTLSVNAPFFGRPAATPAGIYQIASMTKSPIIPVAVVGFDGGWMTVMEEAVVPQGNAVELAATVNRVIEGMIRRRPQYWSNWALLGKRWAKAQQSVVVQGDGATERGGVKAMAQLSTV